MSKPKRGVSMTINVEGNRPKDVLRELVGLVGRLRERIKDDLPLDEDAPAASMTSSLSATVVVNEEMTPERHASEMQRYIAELERGAAPASAQ